MHWRYIKNTHSSPQMAYFRYFCCIVAHITCKYVFTDIWISNVSIYSIYRYVFWCTCRVILYSCWNCQQKLLYHHRATHRAKQPWMKNKHLTTAKVADSKYTHENKLKHIAIPNRFRFRILYKSQGLIHLYSRSHPEISRFKSNLASAHISRLEHNSHHSRVCFYWVCFQVCFYISADRLI